MPLAKVHTAKNETAANIIKGYLESNNIHAVIEPATRDTPVGGMFPTGGTTLNLVRWDVYVPTASLMTARRMLARMSSNSNSDFSEARHRLPLWVRLIQVILTGIAVFLLLFGLIFGIASLLRARPFSMIHRSQGFASLYTPFDVRA